MLLDFSEHRRYLEAGHQSDSDFSNMDNSPLSRLPRELRDLIYAHALVHDDGIRIASVNRPGKIPKALQVTTTPPGSSPNVILTLPMSCRQLYRETISLFYERNCFCFPFYQYSWELLELFLSLLKDDHAKLLTRIVFELLEGHHDRTRKQRSMGIWNKISRSYFRNGARVLPGFSTLCSLHVFDPAPAVSFRDNQTRRFDFSFALGGEESAWEENFSAAVGIRKRVSCYWANAGFSDGDGCRYIKVELRKGVS